MSTSNLASDSTGQGPVVLCIQGVGVAGRGWQPQVDALAIRFRVVAFDNRGVGASARGTGPLTIETMADDTVAVLDRMGIDRAHLVGHSMGGLIALRVALGHPDRVKSLALLCTFADGAAPGRPSLRMIGLGLRARVGTRAMRRQGMVRMIMPAPYLRTVDRRALAARLADLFGRDLGDQPAIIGEQLRAMAACDLTAALPALAGIPTLVVSAAHDPIAPPRLGRAIAAGIAGARYVEIADASHALPIQCPERVNGLLVDHVEAIERRSTAVPA
jgi:3-oxoadipate enol-lactonase